MRSLWGIRWYEAVAMGVLLPGASLFAEAMSPRARRNRAKLRRRRRAERALVVRCRAW